MNTSESNVLYIFATLETSGILAESTFEDFWPIAD